MHRAKPCHFGLNVIQTTDMEQTKPLEGRVALITGASRGIGAATAKMLAAQGAHVILLARTVGGLEAVDDAITEAGGKATLVPLDLSQHDMIDALGASIFERWGKLDILVGNAGMLGPLTPVAHADPKQWAKVLDVNLTANYRLIRSLDPLLRQSDAGRVVFVTASVARDPAPFWGLYAASKAALEHLVHIYAREVQETPIRVNLFDPGVARTAMRAEAFPGENPQDLPAPDEVAKQMLALVMPGSAPHDELYRSQQLVS